MLIFQGCILVFDGVLFVHQIKFATGTQPTASKIRMDKSWMLSKMFYQADEIHLALCLQQFSIAYLRICKDIYMP